MIAIAPKTTPTTRAQPCLWSIQPFFTFITGLVILSIALFSAHSVASTKPLSSPPEDIRFTRYLKSRLNEHRFSYISTLAQGPMGFLWVGTANGLLRYDGQSTHLYRTDVADPTSISANYVRRIAFDHDNIMWVATEHGLNSYDFSTDSFTRWISDPNNPNTIGSNFIKWVSIGKNNEVYIGTSNGMDIISANRKNIKHFEHNSADPNSISHNYIHVIHETSDGKLWIGTEGGGLNSFDPVTQKFKHYKHNPDNSQSIIDNYVTSIIEDQHHRIWVGTLGAGISRIETDGKSITNFTPKDSKYNLPDGIIYEIIEDYQGAIWFLTDRAGALIFNEKENKFVALQNNPYDKSTLLFNTAKGIAEDSNGNIWISTFPSGLHYFNREASKFHYYYNINNNNNTLSNNSILDVTRSKDGTLWVGTEQGLNAINQKQNTVTRYLKGDNPNQLKAHAILAIQEDIDNQLWIGSWNGGVSRLDPATGKLTHYKTGNNGTGHIKSAFVWKIFLDSNNTLWVGTETDGLNRYNRETDSFTSFTHAVSDPKSLSYNYIWDIMEDSQKRLWIATQYGLNLFDSTTETFKHYLPEDDRSPSISTGRLQDLKQDSHGNIWIATQGGGINWFNPNTEEFKHIRVSDGLPDDSVAAIEEDNDGFIWAATSDGLVKIDPENLEIISSFSEANGLMAHEFIRKASHKDDDGTLFFGSTNGLLNFHPKEIQTEKSLPDPIITEFQIFNTPAPDIGIITPTTNSNAKHSPIVLNYTDAMITFFYTAINFQQRRHNRYAYRLDNFDTDWNYVTNRQSATYTNLDPGQYTFKLATTDAHGNLSDQISSMSVEIHPPPWKTFWAYGCYLLILLIVLFTIIRLATLKFTTNKLNKLVEIRTQELSRANNAKTDFLANMSHELRTPLNAIIGFSKRLKDRKANLDSSKAEHALGAIHRNGIHLLAIINDILDIAKIESGTMSIYLVSCDLSIALKQAITDIKPKADEKNLAVIEPVDLPIKQIQADPIRLNQIINNLLSNAIKYTHAGTITITVQTQEVDKTSYCRIAFSDTGIGIRKEDQSKLFTRFEQFDAETRKQKGYGTGLGLALVENLCKAHKGWVECKSEFGKGSTFTVILPINNTIR